MSRHFLIIFLSFLPSLFWLIIVRFIDRKNPEPMGKIIKTFVLGVLIVIPTFFLVKGANFFLEKINLGYFASIIIVSFLIDGLIEEYAKYAVVKNKLYNDKVFNEPLDGFVYMVTAAMGFAFFENFLYLISGKPEIILARFATPTLMHFLASGIIGYHLGEIKFYQPKNKKFILLGSFFLAVAFHGLYNTIIRFGFVWNIIPLAVLLLSVCIYLLTSLRKFSKFSPPLSQKKLF